MTKGTCSIDGCERGVRARGWCDMHYLRWRRHGDPGGPASSRQRQYGPCTVEGCDRPSTAKGLCKMHHRRVRRLGTTDPVPSLAERHGNWRGDSVSYIAVHRRLREYRGRASTHTCACGKPAQQWAYDYSDPNVRADDRGAPFSTDLDRYVAMCASCHQRFDNGHRPGHPTKCPNGHDWVPETTAYRQKKDGRRRICLLCHPHFGKGKGWSKKAA